MEYTTVDKTHSDGSTHFDEDIRDFKDLENSFQKYRISKVLQIYTPNRDEMVLNLGCGFGTFCFAVAPLCREVVGLDSSKGNIDLCNKLLAKSQYTNIKFVCSDVQDIQLQSGSYDVIICADFFEHKYPKIFERVLDECRRILKKGGKLVIWSPYKGYITEILKNENCVDYKSMDRFLNALSKRYFLIKKSYYTESHIPIFCSLERLLLRFLPMLRRRIAILAEKID